MSWAIGEAQSGSAGGWTLGAILAGFGLLVFILLGSDTIMRANGLYGSREFVTLSVAEKRLVWRRRSDRPELHFDHRGERIRAVVTMDEFRRIAVGQRVATVVIPGRFHGRHVFLDGPGLKLDPQTRVVAFGLIVGSHFLALLLLVIWLVRRAERS